MTTDSFARTLAQRGQTFNSDLVSSLPGKGAAMIATDNGGTVRDAIAIYTSEQILASNWPRVVGSHIFTTDGDHYVVAAAGVADHQVTTAGGAKLYVVPDNRRINASAFGLYPGTADISAAFFAAWAKTSALGCILRLKAGSYAVHLSGQTSLTGGFWGLEGAGRLATTIDGGGTIKLGRVRFTGSNSLYWAGFTFANFYNPGYTGDPAVTIDGVVMRDLGMSAVGSGPTLACTLKNVEVEDYYCDGAANPHDPNIAVYGLCLGRDYGTDVANSFNQSKFTLRRIHIKNVNGLGRTAQVPTNGIAIRAWNATIDTFTIENVRAEANSTDCEGFYGKLAYSMVANGYIKDAGGHEGMFVLKGDEPPYINPSDAGGFTATRTTVRNVAVECTDGLSQRGFNLLTNNVDLDFVSVTGVTGTIFAFGGQQGDSICKLRNFKIKGCSGANYIGWNAAGTLIVENGEASDPNTGSSASHPIYGLVVYATVTQSARIIVRNYEINVPSTYTGTGRAVAISLLHQTGINVDLTVENLTVTFDHGAPVNQKLGIVNEGTVTGTTDAKIRGLNTTLNDFYAIRGITAFTTLTATEWGKKTVINYTTAQTFNESHTGRTISNFGAVSGQNHTLPKAQLHMQITFHSAVGTMAVSAASGDTLLGSGSLAVGTRRTATAIAPGVWAIA